MATVLIEKLSNGVGLLKLNRPDRLNSLTVKMVMALFDFNTFLASRIFRGIRETG